MIRRPAVAGMFYPAQSELLERTVRSYLSVPDISSNDSITGLVCPHAGYVYSGSVAGAAFASAPDEICCVVVIAPPHRYPVKGASVFDGEGYSTPLGVAPVDREVTEALLGSGLVFQPEAHSEEHSAEVQIPFVQVRWPEARIAVVLQGSVKSSFSMELARAVSKAVSGKTRTLVVASSDLSHYHSQRIAREKDRLVIEAFLSGDPERLELAESRGGEACGIGPIGTLMRYGILNGSSRFGEIRWTTSAEASGDTGSVVGYFAGYCAGDGSG